MRRLSFAVSISTLTMAAALFAACRAVPPPQPLADAPEAASAPVLGSPNAPTTMVEFFDFQCIHCKQAQAVLDDLLKAYEGRLKIVSRPFMRSYAQTPGQMLKNPSFRAAAAALAADRQGKYPEMTRVLFENQSRFLENDLVRYARAIGLDAERFNRDRKDPAVLSAVEGNARAAEALRIANTPAVLIGGRTYQGERDFDFYSGLVAAELQQAPVPARSETDGRAEPGTQASSQTAAAPGSVTWNDMIFPGSLREPNTSTPVLEVGDKAPDFALRGVCGETFALSSFRGRQNVVVSFVPSAFTPICSGQWPHYIAVKDELDALDTVVLGITTDNRPSLYAWTRGMQGLNFPVLSDFWPHGETAKKYGVLRPESGTSERALFLVDKKGVIRYIDIHDINSEPDMAPLMETLRAVAQE